MMKRRSGSLDPERLERELQKAMEAYRPSPPFPEQEIAEGIGRRLAERARLRTAAAQAWSAGGGGDGEPPGHARGASGERRPNGLGDARPWMLRGALGAAALLVAFLAGVQLGRTAAFSPAGEEAASLGPAAPPEGPGLTYFIQAAGSNYVYGLNRLAAGTTGLGPEDERRAREVAVSILHGAAVELLRDSGDENMKTVVELIEARRESHSSGSPFGEGFEVLDERPARETTSR